MPIFSNAAQTLSRLSLAGTTNVGGNSQYADFIPLLNSVGVLDPSFLSTVVRDYTLEAISGVDPLLAGLTPSASTQGIYSSANDTTHTYARNTNAWFAKYDLTCVSSVTSNGWRVTAITPRHVVTAQHIGLPVGTVCYFTDSNNVTYARTIVATNNVINDLMVDTLDSDLPPSIVPATILPTALPEGYTFSGVPVLYTDQTRSGFVADVYALCSSTTINTTVVTSDDIRIPTETQRAAFCKSNGPAVGGDSSSPYFIVLGGKLVLLGCFFGPTGAGPDVGASASYVTPVIGNNYSLTVANLPSYPATITTINVGTVSTVSAYDTAHVTNVGTPTEPIFNFGIPQGVPGIAASVAIGTVTLLPPGSTPTVVNVGSNNAAVLNIGLPQGAQGVQGPATISIGTITTLAAGSNATVTNSGTSQNMVLNIGLPQGPAPNVYFGSGLDFDRLVINGTTIGPHLTGPTGNGTNLDGGTPDSSYNSILGVDGGTP